jgi:hypothetical protein
MRGDSDGVCVGLSIESSSSPASSASVGSACVSDGPWLVHQLQSLYRIGASLRECVGASAGGGGSGSGVSGVTGVGELQFSVEI